VQRLLQVICAAVTVDADVTVDAVVVAGVTFVSADLCAVILSR
jgi:hypothetical protein